MKEIKNLGELKEAMVGNPNLKIFFKNKIDELVFLEYHFVKLTKKYKCSITFNEVVKETKYFQDKKNLYNYLRKITIKLGLKESKLNSNLELAGDIEKFRGTEAVYKEIEVKRNLENHKNNTLIKKIESDFSEIDTKTEKIKNSIDDRHKRERELEKKYNRLSSDEKNIFDLNNHLEDTGLIDGSLESIKTIFGVIPLLRKKTKIPAKVAFDNLDNNSKLTLISIFKKISLIRSIDNTNSKGKTNFELAFTNRGSLKLNKNEIIHSLEARAQLNDIIPLYKSFTSLKKQYYSFIKEESDTKLDTFILYEDKIYELNGSVNSLMVNFSLEEVIEMGGKITQEKLDLCYKFGYDKKIRNIKLFLNNNKLFKEKLLYYKKMLLEEIIIEEKVEELKIAKKKKLDEEKLKKLDINNKDKYFSYKPDKELEKDMKKARDIYRIKEDMEKSIKELSILLKD